MRLILSSIFVLAASPALAAVDKKKPFFTLTNTDFVVWIAFVIFIGVLIYFKVPGLVAGMLDKRADSIKAELEEAKALREEAQALLASYERKQKEVQEQSARIVAAAKEEATNAATVAKEDIAKSITRRLAAAEEQIASAEASAVKEVRDQAIAVAIGAAKDVIAKQMDATSAGALIDDSIVTVAEKLH
jgi:F-type H+-transporting ATPase subunit b